MNINNLKLLFPLLFILSLTIVGHVQLSLPTLNNDPFAVFPSKLGSSAVVRFNEISHELGLNHRHHLQLEETNTAYNPFRATASVAAHFFFNSDYLSFIFTDWGGNQPLYFYQKNSQGKYIEIAANKINMAKLKKNCKRPSGVAAADFDNDGFTDILLSCYDGCLRVLKNNGKYFDDISEKLHLPLFCKGAEGLNVFDINHDGFLDVYMHIFSEESEDKRKIETSNNSEIDNMWNTSTANSKQSKSSNLLFKNILGKKFIESSVELNLNDPGYTWGSIAFYQDKYFFPSLYIINDFGFSRLYASNSIRYKDNSQQVFSRYVERGEMGGDAGDVNNDGLMDLYITNLTRPGNRRGYNSLLIQQSSGVFQNEALSHNVESCGFGWGAKFADIDLDGQLDLFVLNGYWNLGDKPLWYRYMTYLISPSELRNFSRTNFKVANTQLATNQRNCLFLNNNDHFVDITESANIHDTLDGRGVAVIDLDNEGKSSFLIANVNFPPILYHNISDLSDKNWIGFQLIGTKSNKDGIGARIKITNSINQVFVKENFPGNGNGSWNDPRIIFGLNQNQNIKEIEIQWPSGIVQKISNLKLNKYHKIIEKP